MATLIRAASGFLIAFGLLHEEASGTAFRGPALSAVKADIEAQHPGMKIQAALDRGLNRLGLSPSLQIETPSSPGAPQIRARGLHS